MKLDERVSKLEGGEIIELRGGHTDKVRVLILKKNEDNSVDIYQPDTKNIINNYIIKDEFIEVASISKLDQYVWLGLEYGSHKILLNLKSLNMEYFNSDISLEWEYLDDEYIIEETDEMILISFPDVMIKIELMNLSCRIMDNTTNKFKNYHNFLLGREGEFVFDESAELELSK